MLYVLLHFSINFSMFMCILLYSIKTTKHHMYVCLNNFIKGFYVDVPFYHKFY